jgi:hypothetical protein
LVFPVVSFLLAFPPSLIRRNLGEVIRISEAKGNPKTKKKDWAQINGKFIDISRANENN